MTDTFHVADRRRGLIALAVLAIIALAIYFTYKTFFTSFDNYAKDAARPLEKSLIAHGAIKKCEKGDSGLGPDNREPWYSALYEVPGDMATATKVVFESASQSGFKLADSKSSVDVQDNKFYEDTSSKKSSYSALDPGNISLLVEVYGSKVFGDKEFCTVKPGPSQNGTTTIDVTLNLPSFKN